MSASVNVSFSFLRNEVFRKKEVKMSEELRAALCGLLKMLSLLAKKTANPIDDIVIRALQAMLGCKD